jgi:hypothetical protein
MKSRLALAVVAIALLAACSGGGNAQSNSSQGTAQNAASPAAAATNNTDFPLPDGATVLAAHDWSKTVSGSSGGGGMFSQGAGKYSGHDTVAQTSESLADAQTWLKGLVAKPPKDYTVVPSSSGIDEARKHAAAMGIDFSAFQHTVDGKKQGVVVIVMDPKLLNEKAGPMLGLIDKYKMLPQGLRDPIDAQAKARTGYSVSDAVDPAQPIGAALAAITQLSTSGDRGIILVDATKQ